MLVPIAAVRIINHALYSSHQRTPGFTISVLYYLYMQIYLEIETRRVRTFESWEAQPAPRSSSTCSVLRGAACAC
jgi:hypothetical protein